MPRYRVCYKGDTVYDAVSPNNEPAADVLSMQPIGAVMYRVDQNEKGEEVLVKLAQAIQTREQMNAFISSLLGSPIGVANFE